MVFLTNHFSLITIHLGKNGLILWYLHTGSERRV